MLLVIADSIEVAEGGLRGSVGGFCGVFAKIVDDGASGGKCVRVIVEAEAGEFGYTELFAEDARGIVVLEGPIFDAAFDASGAIEKGGL